MRYIECGCSAAVESILCIAEKVKKWICQSFGGVSEHFYSNLFAESFVCRLKRNASAVVNLHKVNLLMQTNSMMNS
jgi:hypothetical protein